VKPNIRCFDKFDNQFFEGDLIDVKTTPLGEKCIKRTMASCIIPLTKKKKEWEDTLKMT